MSEGRSCVGCGYCCSEIMCRIGTMIYGHYMNPCPALTWDGKRYQCMLYQGDPTRYEHILAIGDGCCFPSNPWRENVIRRK